MPLYKRYKGKYGKNEYKKRPKNMYYRRTVNKAYKLAKYAVSRLNAESNIIDTSHNGTSIGTTMNIQLLNGTTQGDGNSNREGNSIRMKSVYLRLHNILSQNAAAIFNVCRIMIVLDKQPNGAIFSGADLLENTGIPVASPYEKDFSARFEVLLDKVVTMSKTGNEGVFYKKYINLGQKVRYNETNGGTIADINTNALYLCIVTNASSPNEPTFYTNVRLRFVDN